MSNPSRTLRTSAAALSSGALFFTLTACSASSGAPSPDSSSGNRGSGNGPASFDAGSSVGPGAGGTAGGSFETGGAFTVGPAERDATAPTGGECGGQTFPLAQKPAKLLLVFDRSGSMKDPPSGAKASTSKWDLTVPAVSEVIMATDARVSWGLKTFPEGDTTSCVVTDVIDVPIAAINAAKVTAAIAATTPNGNGTPTGDAISAAVKYLDSLAAAGDTDQKYIVLATDGEPSCVDGSEKSQSTSRPYAVQAVTDAEKAGYHTFVVGVSTTNKSATQALNDMAVAGGEERSSSDPDAGANTTKFYLASTKDELVTAFDQITGAVLDCRFALSSAPPDNAHVGVILGTERVPPDSWMFTGVDKTTIEVTGDSCSRIKAGTNDSLRIVFGCPSDPIIR